MMKKRIFAFWLALILLPVPGIAHADVCAVCAGAGYVSRSVFGTGETVLVNCPACVGTAMAADETQGSPLPEENEPAADFAKLPDPGQYANYTDQCVYAELDYAVFECEMGYDIDTYISDLTKNTGLKIANRYDLDDGNYRYYQLALSEGLDSCQASVFYHADGRISLSVKDSACVQLPDRAKEVQLFTWEPEKKSIHLPDVSAFAKAEVSVREWTENEIAYDCGEDFDFDGYLDVLRYEYGFDVEAVMQDHNEKATCYALYNPDLNEKKMRIGSDTDIEKANRHLEITYSSFDYLHFKKAGGSKIQLPVSSGAYYKEESKSKTICSMFPVPFGDATHVSTQSVYTDVSAPGFERYVSKFLNDYDIVKVSEEDGVKTYFLLIPGYHVQRLKDENAHVSVSYHQNTEKIYVTKAAGEIKLAGDKKIEPIPTPNPDPDPDPTPNPNPNPNPYPNPDPGESRCSVCGGSGERDCLGCSGGYIDCGGCYDGTVRCGSCGGADKRCFTCGGDGRKDCSSCNGSGRRECSSCRGRGKDRCSSCGGDGKR